MGRTFRKIRFSTMKNFSALLFFLIPFLSFSQQQEKIIIHFEFNKYNLDSSSQKKIHDAILNKSISAISISAYCDSIGSDAYNDALSMRRANQVKSFLISENINERLI